MPPHPELALTAYCLANPGVEYLVYQPKSGEGFSVDLKPGNYAFEWFDPAKGLTAESGRLESKDKPAQFRAPFQGEALLHLKAQ
jgi:hypothetical protein